MSMVTLAICLTTSNLPWFTDLTFQVPVQYCSLQHQILLLSLVTSTTGYWFCFGSIPSFFLELYLHWSPVAYWALNWPGEFLFQYPIILPFHTVHGVLKARTLKWFAILFSSGPKWSLFISKANHSISKYAPTSNAEEGEVQWFYEDLQDLLELTPKKMSFSSQRIEMQK